MSLETLTGSPYLSFSSLESWLTCGERYRLEKVIGVEQTPAWYLLGGSAVHEATEIIDRAALAKGCCEDTAIPTIEEAWDAAWAKQLSTIEDVGKVRAGGRASKQWPNKEDASWWTHHGPFLVAAWVAWKEARLLEGWTLLEVEHAFQIEIGSVPVRGYIDRIFADANGQTRVIDLKTGSHSPAGALQLGIYALGYHANTGVTPTIGQYFMNRKGEATEPESLTKYTQELVGNWFDMAKRAIEAQVFVPHVTAMCSSCSVQAFCAARGGTPPTHAK